MQKAGEHLKIVREEKGYSIAEVSKNTKISSSVLRALEEGRLDNIDPIYLKGFLKIYCRFLGIDWQDFLKEYPAVSQIKHPHKPKGSGLASNSQSHRPEATAQETKASFILENKRRILAGLSAVAALLFIVLIFRGCLTLLLKKSPTPKTFRKALEPQTAKRPALPRNTQNAPAKTLTPSSKDSKTRDITLVIRAQEDSFLKVRVDGRLVYQGSLHKGKAETWIAKDRIELSVGNAGAVMLEVNGKILPSLGRRGQAIKSILINSEGLRII